MMKATYCPICHNLLHLNSIVQKEAHTALCPDCGTVVPVSMDRKERVGPYKCKCGATFHLDATNKVRL